MDSYELTEMITSKIMYQIGESTTIVGLFITIVGATMMIYNHDFIPIKNDMEVDMV